MGFSFNPVKAIVRAVGGSDELAKDINLAFPVISLPAKGVEIIGNKIAGTSSSSRSSTPRVEYIGQDYNPYSGYGQSPIPYYAPSGFSADSYSTLPSFAPGNYQDMQEVLPWDYSIYSHQMTVPPMYHSPVFYQTSSIPSDGGAGLLDLAIPLALAFL